ncbi:MAG: hypothetical protein ABIJ27_04110 [Candidatus Omnitrophota bacterium]
MKKKNKTKKNTDLFDNPQFLANITSVFQRMGKPFEENKAPTTNKMDIYWGKTDIFHPPRGLA